MCVYLYLIDQISRECKESIKRLRKKILEKLPLKICSFLLHCGENRKKR